MVPYTYLFDILKLAVAGIGVVWFAYYLIKPYLQQSERKTLIELKKIYSTQTLPLRLQAYERVILLIERINPTNMLVRLNAPSYTAEELQSIVINEVRNEFQHNITQQIYVSAQAWAVLRKIKDDTINLVTNCTRALPAEATGMDLSRMVLTQLSQLEENPYDIAASMIKKELEPLF